MDLQGLVLFLGCLACALAAPLSSSTQCDTKCIVPSGFREGRTYVYSYSTKTSTYIQGEQYGYSNLTVSCEARLEVIGTCEIVLELTDISVEETNRDGNTITSPNEDAFRNHLTRNRLRFAMQAGKVTSVCPQPEEMVWATNFKRGVLSALQLTLPESMPGREIITESTVSGTCETEVIAQDSEMLLKVKDFSRCEDRFNMPWLMYGIKLNPQAPTASPVVSEQYCRQGHDSGNYVTWSECEEVHILKPVSDQENGPATLVIQTLSFDRIIKAPSNHRLESVQERKSIVFEHHKHMEESKMDSTVADDLISQLCDSLSGGVDTDTAKLYPAIINEMRRLESTTLASALAAATCEGYQTTLNGILTDALGECKSSGCIEIMVNLIQDGTVQDKKIIKKWIHPLNFVEHPTKEMVSHLMELAEDDTIRASLFLAVSSIINKYCTVMNPNCQQEPEISTAIDFFENILGSRCRYQNKEEKRKMMIAIHALGNAGIHSRGLRKCFDSESTDMALRIAAIQAASQTPCDEQDIQESLIAILQKTSQDTELRITAYKALMVCPSPEILDVLDNLLNEEMSNQVGGYIVSHLKNIQSSQDPLKADQRSLLEDHPITAKFIDDPMKFSKNFELSWYNETTGYGLAGESDIIFSSNSFIPRQISVKGQVDALGYAFEAFELGGRMEGMQGLLESAFGPLSSYLGEEEETRQKRSLIKDNKLENVIDEFEVTGDGEADGSVYLKILGREMLFIDAEDIKAMFASQDSNDYLMELAMLAQGQTYETSRTSMLMENRMSVPLANGLELKFSINGSTTDRFKASGKLDIMGMVMKPRSMEIDGTIEPSSAVDISCLMEVEAHCTRIGINYEVSGHTATSLSGKISVEEGKNIQLKLRAPEQKQELISISSKVSFLHQEQLDIIPSSSLELTEEEICTGEFLENAIGMRICGESKYHETPQGETPLSGAYQFSLTAQKVEADLESYDVEVSYNLDKKMVDGEKQETDMFHLMFGTPNTAKDRSYGIDFEFKRTSREFSADLICPHISTVHVVGSRVNEENHKRLDVMVTTNDGSEYSLYYNFEKTESEEGKNFYPTLRIITPRFGTLQFLGSVIDTDNQMSLDVSLQGESRQFMTINGQTTKVKGNKKSQYDTELTIGGEYVQGGMQSSVQVRDGLITIETTLTKQTIFGEDRSVTISAKHNSRGAMAVNQDFYVSCEFSHSPDSNFRLDGDLEATGLTSQSTFKFCYGQTTCSSNKKIIISHNMDFEMEENNLDGTLTVSLQHPYQGTHLVLSHHAMSTHGKRNFTVSIIDESESVVLASVRLGADYNSEGNSRQGSVELSLTTPGSIKRLNQTWAMQESGELHAVNLIQWQEDRSLVTTAVYSKDGDTRHNMDVVITFPNEVMHHFHSHVDSAEDEITTQVTFSTDREERFYLQATGNRETTGTSGGSGSVRVRTPFHLLNDFLVSFQLNCHEASGYDSTWLFKHFPEEDTYTVSVMHEKTSSGLINDKRSQVVLTLPSSSYTFLGMVHQNEEHNEKKAGLSLIVQTEEEEKIFGIEGKVIDNSDYWFKDIFFRVNTTAPYHKNAVEFTVTDKQDEFNCIMDIEYFLGKHLTTTLNIVRKEDGFTFKTVVKAPYQSAILILDHTFEPERLFNPHLSLDITSFDVHTTLLDVDLKLIQEPTVHGKNGKLQLAITGPGKTLLFSSGVVRNDQGFNYFIELGNEEEVRLRIDLNTAVYVLGGFNANIELTASSVYAPEWPVQCGIHLEQQNMDQFQVVVYFNVDEEPLFHFNISKSVVFDLPGVNFKQDVLVRVKVPTSINANLHNFGMHVGREETTTQDGLPEKAGSLSFFWGPEPNQQLTFSSASSVQRTDESLQVGGSLVLVQPLRTTHLQQEYSLDYSVNKQGPNLDFSLTFNHGDGEMSTLDINHSEGEKDGNRNFVTAITAAAREGKSFKLSSDVTPKGGRQFDSNFAFIMDDGDYHEEAELDMNLNKHSEENLDRTLEITFEHSPSGMDLTSLTSIRNSDSLMYFGVESQCSVPTLESPVHLAFETQLDKTTKTLMIHALGPANDIILRGNVYNLTEEEKISYRLETNNEINGESKTFNVQLDCDRKASGDIIFETGQAERIIHLGYVNDSSIQATLTKDDHQNAQTSVTVLNPHTLYTLITWDTTWPQIFKEAAIERLEAVEEQFNEGIEIYREIFQTISEDFTTYMTSARMRNQGILTKMQEIKEGIRGRLTEMKENYQIQRQTIKSKFVSFKEEARENLRPLVEEYREMRSSGNSEIQTVRDHIRDEVTAYFEGASRALSGYRMSVLGSLVDHYLELCDSLQEKIELDQEMMENFKARRAMRIERMKEEINMMRESWEESKQNFRDKWDEFSDLMSGMINRAEFEDMKLGFQLNPVFSDSSRIHSDMIEMLEAVHDRLETLKQNRQARRELMSQDLRALSDMKFHFRTVNNVPSIGIKLFHGELLRNLRDSIKSTMQEKCEELYQWIIEQNQGYKLLYDTEEGRIELWLYTDQRYDDLISPPVNDPLGNLKVALGRLAEDFPLLDDMRKYKSQLYENMDLVMTYLHEVAQPAFEEQLQKGQSMNLEDLWGWKAMVNTYFYEMLSTDCMKAQAFLVGDQHYKTFDGSYYEFAGKCSFLAAQDFVDNTFTVAVEYNRAEGTMSKSFVVIADGVTMELRGHRVYIGRDELELPYAVSEAVSITRDVNNIYITSTGGFTITYNLPHDIFKVELGILYFGKTAGLFGNFNHEPNDDLVDSNGEVSQHIDEFARSWEIGKKCTSHLNKASACDISPTLEQNLVCAQTFLDGLGPASNGHPAVNPEPYYTMCASLRCTEYSYAEAEKQICSIFQAYVQECKSKGLTWINMPEYCHHCPLSEQVSVSPYYDFIDVPRGADMVIVLEQEWCMSERSQQIIDLMDKVHTELKRDGYRDNRFGVVGFGGAGIHQAAHVETIDGELFGPAQGLLLSLRDMPFDGEGMSDAWGAISFAMNYPFRAGVAKHIIFMACSECPERSRAAGSLRIQKAMNDQGIKFTMLMDYTFNLGEKSAKENDEIFGIDKIGVYTDKLAGIDVDYFKGDPGLLHFVNQPNNPCTKLAIATEGALFSTDSMGTKNFKDVFALWIVKHSQTHDTAVCKCVERNSGYTQSICY